MNAFEKRLTKRAYQDAIYSLQFSKLEREKAAKKYNAQNAANFAVDLVLCGEASSDWLVGVEQCFINSYAYELRETMIEKLISIISVD